MKAMELLPPSDTMYRALVNRDSSFEGIFFVGVRTTGIFCRPDLLGEKAGAPERRFLFDSERSLHGGYRPVFALPADGSGRAAAGADRAAAG